LAQAQIGAVHIGAVHILQCIALVQCIFC